MSRLLYLMRKQSITSGRYRMVAIYGGALYTSSDYGDTWVQITAMGNKNWEYSAISRDGKYFLISTYGSYIYISSDYGVSFTAKNTTVGVKNYQGVAISDTGQYMIVGTAGNYLYVSSDYGNTWDQKTSLGTKPWQSASMSGDGRYQLFACYKSGCYLSSDYGATFSLTNTAMGSAENRAVGVNIDGSYMTIANITAKIIYVSTDYGSSWNTQSNLSFGVGMMDISASGQYQIIRSANDLYYSENWGVTFSIVYSSSSLQNLAITDNGLSIITASYGGLVAQSKDKGNNFIAVTSLGNKNWFAATLCKTP